MEVLRSTPLERVTAPFLFPHRTSVVRMYVYWNTETSTADLVGRDLHQINMKLDEYEDQGERDKSTLSNITDKSC